MQRPRMIVIAGPPGSGKTRFFPVTAYGLDSFNIDDRCAQILGTYRAIPRNVRRAVARECEKFVLTHIKGRLSFAVETTLRTAASIEQAELFTVGVGIAETRRPAAEGTRSMRAVIRRWGARGSCRRGR